MTVLAGLTLHLVNLPLTVPYHVSYRVYEDFDPILVEARDADGRIAWGEGHISPGYSDETVAGGFAFCEALAADMVGRATAEAKAMAQARRAESPVAASALITALEWLEDNPLLNLDHDVTLPLLTPFHATDPGAIEAEVEERLAQGFRTLKVKVGKDWRADLARVDLVRAAAAGRAVIRLDANRGFSEGDGVSFARGLEPEGIELFEQPCASADWEANGAVAAASRVPVMLDESIYGLDDIDRAGAMPGVGLVKLKLKKMGGVEDLRAGLARIRELGMEPVLGDGVAADIGCWMEACVARLGTAGGITNAGEFNGFLKTRTSLLANPMTFADGSLRLPAGYRPEIDRGALAAHTKDRAEFPARVNA
ncbi:MAG: enolase C-terminal domain-like protein [Alphaproteobacteria bacterium]|nr:enolase C-terminal domain-like protein [Alphaproteobacteria bacterium]